MVPNDKAQAKARVLTKIEAREAMSARERIFHTLCATNTHAEAEAMLAEVEQNARNAGAVTTQPRKAVEPSARSAFLANKLIETHKDVVSAEPVDAATLDLTVQPENLGSWDWWLGRLHIPTGTTTYRGSYATAKGSFGRVQVLLTGLGVGELMAAERRNNGGAA